MTFTVTSHVKVVNPRPLEIRGGTYDLVLTNGLLAGIKVTVNKLAKEYWPTLTLEPEKLVNVRVPPEFHFIRNELKATQGLLHCFGVQDIDIRRPLLEWVPETLEEKNQLHIYNFKMSLFPHDPNSQSEIPFSIVARALIAAEDAYNIELPLNLYRHGVADLRSEKYIDAFSDFYFVLEHLYGKGNTQNKQICKAFKDSTELKESIADVLRTSHAEEALQELGIRSRYKERFRQFFAKYNNPESIIDFLVNLRGTLHHKNSKRRNSWHPDEQGQFEFEAVLLNAIVSSIVVDLTHSCLKTDKVTQAFLASARRCGR